MLVTAHMTILARCKLTPAGYRQLDQRLGALNRLYNQALENRIKAWSERRQALSLYDQYRWLTHLRAQGREGLGGFALGPQRGMLKRLDEAFKGFFRRVKAGQNPGFPRFRPLSRCVTIDVTKVGKSMVKGGKIHVRGLPAIRIRHSQALPPGEALKALRLTKRGRHWEASLVYAVERQALPATVRAVGIDMGVRKRMTLSDGTTYAPHKRAWKRIRKAQRAVSRCQKGSHRRRKRCARLARCRRREFVRQRNACHRASTRIVREHGLVAVEKLNVKNMTKSAKGTVENPGAKVRQKAGLNREVLSQNWSLLRSQLAVKAAWAGREYVEVDPKHTSRDCSRCHARNNPGWSETYCCGACGLKIDRDVNAAVNILAAGVLAAGASTWAIGPCVAPESCMGVPRHSRI